MATIFDTIRQSIAGMRQAKLPQPISNVRKFILPLNFQEAETRSQQIQQPIKQYIAQHTAFSPQGRQEIQQKYGSFNIFNPQNYRRLDTTTPQGKAQLKTQMENITNIGYGFMGTAPSEGNILKVAARKIKISPEMLVEKLRTSTVPFAKRLETRIAEESSNLIAQVGRKAIPQVAKVGSETVRPSYSTVATNLPEAGTQVSPLKTAMAKPLLGTSSIRYVSPSQEINLGGTNVSIQRNVTTLIKNSQDNVYPFSSQIEKATNIKPSVRVKTPSSLLGKVERYQLKGRNPNEIADTLAGKIETTPDKISQQLENIKRNFNVVEVEDYSKIPSTWGYRGVNIKVTLPNGRLAEIQIHTPESWKKTKQIHTLYEKWRNFDTTKLSSSQKAQYLADKSKSQQIATKGVEGVTYRGANVAQEAVRKGRNASQLAGLETKEVPPAKLPVLKVPTTGGVPPSVPGSPSSGSIIAQSDEELVKSLSQALKGAEKARGIQEELYSKTLSQKFAKMMSAREKMAGEKGLYEELGALKGQPPKVQYEPIRQQFNQPSIDRLFNMIKGNKVLDEWDKINAQIGLSKILGEKGVGVPTRGEIEKLYTVYGKEFTESLLSKRTVFEKLTDWGMQLYNLPRSTMAGFGDLSATLMQNLMFAYRHPFITSKNFGKQIQMFGSDAVYKASGEEIAARPTYELMKRAKIAFTDVGPIVRGREEQFMTPLAEKIPVVGKVIRMTGRAYSGFLNRMRADVFDNLYYSAKAGGVDVESSRFLNSLGEFVNAGTGRGNLPGSLERAAPILAQGFFSARKLAAAFQLINPLFYIRADPFVRMEALKTWASFVGGGMTILGVAKLAGADVSNDPTSADFGKIKVGNTRFNVFGTYQQVAVLLARLYKGYATSSTTGTRMTLGEGYKPLTSLDLITRFFENKEHPTISFIAGMMKGQNQMGDPFNMPKEALNRFIPMVMADAYDLYREHGPVGLLGMIPAILGVPVQTYGAIIPTKGITAGGKANIQYNPAPGLGEAIVNKVTGTPESNIPKEQWKPIVAQHTRELIQKEITTIQNQINNGVIKSDDGLKRIQELQKKMTELPTSTTSPPTEVINPKKIIIKTKKAKKFKIAKAKKGKAIKAPKLSFKKAKLAKVKIKKTKLAKVKQYKSKVKGIKVAKLPEKVTYRLRATA